MGVLPQCNHSITEQKPFGGKVKYVICMTVILYKYIVPFRFDLFRLPKDVSIFETELQYFAQFDLNLQTVRRSNNGTGIGGEL